MVEEIHPLPLPEMRNLSYQLPDFLSEACLGNGISGGFLEDAAVCLCPWNGALFGGTLVLHRATCHCGTPSSYLGHLPGSSQERVLWAQ